MGFVQQVPYLATGVYAPIDEINETINYTRDYADDQMALLDDTIAQINSLIGQYTPSFENVGVDIPAINAPEFPDAPVLDVDINENWPTNGAVPPVINEINPDFSYVAPTPPDQIDPNFDYAPGAYSSCLWSDLCTRVRDELINGGNGLTDAIYGLILNRNTEARRNAEEQNRRRAYDAVGATGFDMPAGMAAAVVLELDKEIIAKDYDAINSTTIKDFEMADANARFIKDLSLKLEQVQRAAYDSEEERLFQIAKATQDTIIAIYEANIKIYIAEWEGVKIQFEAVKLEVEALTSYNESNIKVYIGQIEAYKVEVEAIASENESKTEVAKAEASIYESEVRAISVQISALVEEAKLSLEEYRIKVGEVIDKERVNLEAYSSAAQLAADLAKSIANIASQGVASALGSINTSMGTGYSGSESLSYSSSLGNSLSEGHSYEHE